MRRLGNLDQYGFWGFRRWGNWVVGVPVGLAVVGLLVPAPSSAQMYGQRLAGRSQLTASLDSLQEVLGVTKNRDRIQAIQRETLGIRYRLQHGDIWAGDVVSLSVAGEAKWTDDFTVSPDRELELPDIDLIPLGGVLYSEAEATVSSALSRYMREPRVRLEVLKRIAVLGQVGTPGFFNVKGSALVSDVLMLAGGPTGRAKVRAIRIRRAGERVAPGRPRLAFGSLSLDRLGVVSGDELFVPRKAVGPIRVFLGVLGAVGTVTFIVVRITR